MKKVFIAILAVTALAACNKSEVVETAPAAAIAFDQVFVNNATKAADLTAGNFDFGVFGYVEKGGNGALIFDNQTVARDGSYSPAQYWIAGAQYYFAALAPKTDAKWNYTSTNAHTGTIAFNNEGANQDLIYSYNKPAVTADPLSTQPAKVGFTFNHMLSRVRFTFTNGFAEGTNMTIKVTNVNITDAYANGTLEVTDGAPAAEWAATDKNLNVAFGNAGDAAIAINGAASTEHFYLIPAEGSYNVSFTVEVIQAGVVSNTYDRTATLTADMNRGGSYDIKTTLNASNVAPNPIYPIEFQVNSVEGWDDYSDVTGTVNNQ